MRKYILGLLLALLLFLPVAAENRTALVIGNGNYSHFSRLTTPRSEAQSMKSALERMGFKVILLLDGTEDQIMDALADFEILLQQRGGLALFHYGGHGIQVEGANYIIPVDADIPDERRVRSRAVEVDEVIAAMDISGSSTNIVILDACRDNPLPGASRSASRGLAVVGNPPPDSIIVYAADAGTTAQDGLFTPTLLRYLELPGMEFTHILRKVRRDVRTASGGRQRTGEYNQLESEIYLAGPVAILPPPLEFELDKVKYGKLHVSVAEEGTLYLDGRQMGVIGAGRSATLSDIIVGDHEVEVRYGGHTEKRSVRIVEEQTMRAVFSWRSPSAASQMEKMVLVEGGTFQMGSPYGNKKPVHTVRVSSFYIGRFEVTQGEYEALMGENLSGTSTGIGENYPVNNVSWYDAVEYCNALSRKEGLNPCYSGRGDSIHCDFRADGYRLPTEAEWEYAARGGQQSQGYFYAGSHIADDVAWVDDNAGRQVHPVGLKQPNELELYDMSGNVWEWCWDWYGDYSAQDQSDPTGPSSGSNRVSRGGGWGNDESRSAVAERVKGDSGRYMFLSYNGFRLVRPYSP